MPFLSDWFVVNLHLKYVLGIIAISTIKKNEQERRNFKSREKT